MFQCILIAIDGWEYTTRLLDLAKRVCTHNTKVEIIYIDNPFVGKPQTVELAEMFVETNPVDQRKQVILDALRYLDVTGGIVGHGIITGGDTAAVIVKHAMEKQSDLIIMGHRHLTKLNRIFDPSITIQVVKTAACPVLVDSLKT